MWLLYFVLCQEFGRVWGFGTFFSDGRWHSRHSTDLQATENHVRSQEKTLMQKCSSCFTLTASSIIGTRSKNGVLGGDKHNFITIIWEGQTHPFKKINKFKQSALSVNKYKIRAKVQNVGRVHMAGRVYRHFVSYIVHIPYFTLCDSHFIHSKWTGQMTWLQVPIRRHLIVHNKAGTDLNNVW